VGVTLEEGGGQGKSTQTVQTRKCQVFSGHEREGTFRGETLSSRSKFWGGVKPCQYLGKGAKEKPREVREKKEEKGGGTRWHECLY